MPILILFFLVFVTTPSFAEQPAINATQCTELGGEIINTLTQKGCEPESGFLGPVMGVRCPCICCKKAPDYSVTILDKNGYKVSAQTVIVSVHDGVTPERVEAIAKEIGAYSRIIGLEIGAYEIVIPAVKNADELEAVMEKLRKYKEFKYVETNGIIEIDD